jgi:hypothetical protein
MKSKEMRVKCRVEIVNKYKIFVGKPEGKDLGTGRKAVLKQTLKGTRHDWVVE